MHPANTQRWSTGTGHTSAAPRLSTTQHAPSLRALINSHPFRRRCPPAVSSDDFYGDVPPPYSSRPPLESMATGSTNAEGSHGTTQTCRRVNSESSPSHNHDDDFLANLAAIQILSGCAINLGRKSSARSPCCGTECDAIGCMCVLEDLHRRLLSKELSKHPTRPLRIQPTLHGGADGHKSLESTDRCDRFPSGHLDRRLQSIDDVLNRDSFASESSNKRLHTSEVSRKQQSLTTDDTVDIDHARHDHSNVEEVSMKNTSRGILGSLRSLQHKESPKRWIATSPSLDSSKMPSPGEAEVSRHIWSKITVTLKSAGRFRNPINAPSLRIAQTW